MRIPKRFKIKGKTWRVVYRKRLREDGEPCRGLCVFDDRTIKLQLGMGDLEAENIFLHELVHAALFEAHLDENSGLHAKTEEIVCDAVADVLTTAFKVTPRKKK